MRQHTVDGIPDAVGDVPRNDGQNSAQHFLDHFVEIEHGAKHHKVPQQLQRCDGDEKQSNVGRVLFV